MEKELEKLSDKLQLANIKHQIITPSDPNLSKRLNFEIQCGREQCSCLFVLRDKVLPQIISYNFEKFNFITGFEAIWSKELNTIEAGVSSPSSLSQNFFFRKLYNLLAKNESSINNERNYEINLPSIDNIDISIGYCSNEFIFLSECREFTFRGITNKTITLKLKNISVNTHDRALEILEKISNSLFFQIDLATDIPITLQPQKESFIEKRTRRTRKKNFIDESIVITKPSFEYDSEAISLYWYAKESINMPIFQFLAFYQSIEFYFPIYSNLEAKQKIQNLLKNPLFNSNKDTDINKIMSVIKVHNNGKSYGSEREQLKATLNACTNNSELKEFLSIDEERKNFFIENRGNKIAKQKISLGSEKSDLLAEVSERIYEIRCRIVHSKASEGNFDVLLPYSLETKNLNFDIELIEFISKKVLITSSRPFKL